MAAGRSTLFDKRYWIFVLIGIGIGIGVTWVVSLVTGTWYEFLPIVIAVPVTMTWSQRDRDGSPVDD